MTGNNNKLRSLFLATLMVMSVFGGTMALSGAVAAANAPQGITDNTDSVSVYPDNTVEVADLDFDSPGDVDNVTLNLSADALTDPVEPGDVDSVTVRLYDSSGSEIDETTVSYDEHDTWVNYSSTMTGVAAVNVVADTAGSASDGEEIDAEVGLLTNADADADTVVDTVGVQTIESDNGFIVGDVTDSSTTDSLEGVTIEVYRDNDNSGDVTPGDTLVTTEVTNNDGRYTANVVPATDEYVVEADRTGFETAASPSAVTVTSGSATTVDLVLTPRQVATDLDVTPEFDAARADGESQVTFTVHLTGREGTDTGVGIPNRNINVDLSDLTDDTPDPAPPITTNESGYATINISSGTVQEEDIEFSYTNSTGVTLSNTSTARFTELIRSGDGVISGTVDERVDNSESNIDAATGVNVHAVTIDRVLPNTVFQGVAADENESVRVVTLDSGGNVTDVLDVREDYLTGTPGNLELSHNTSIPGTGFDVSDNDGNGGDYTVTVLEPGDNYALQFSDNGSFLAPTTTDPFTAENDLTFDATQERYENVSAQPTDVTNDHGDFELYNLYTAPDSGESRLTADSLPYVVIASEGNDGIGFAGAQGYDQQLVVQDSDSGTEAYIEFLGHDGQQYEIDLSVQEIPVEPENVNITNVGLFENGTVSEFDNQTDAFAQEVSRDGSIDRIMVETTSEDGTYTNGTVTLEVSDFDVNDDQFNITGDFVAVDGGVIVDEGGEDTVTVATGDDGVAYVHYKTDNSSETLDLGTDGESGISATLLEAPATDFTNKTFVGVISWSPTGSINAPITNENNEGIPNSVVYTDYFEDDAGNSIDIEPVNELDVDTRAEARSAEFNVTFEDTSGNTEMVTVTGAELESFDIEAAFPSISLSQDRNVTLLTFPSQTENAVEYTLPFVPAEGSTPADGIQYTVRGVQFETAESGLGSTPGVYVGVTQPGNIVITGTDPIDDGDNGDSGLPDVALPYDTNDNGQIEIGELGTAAGDFSSGDLTISELGQIAAAFSGN